MGNREHSKFADPTEWRVVSRNGHKELLESKESKAIYEKHTLEGVSGEEMRRESAVYEWRNQKKSIRHIVECVEMRLKSEQDQQAVCGVFCKQESETKTLTVYTQHIYKLYENSPRFQFSQLDQLNLFQDIVVSLEMLAGKFGCFGVSKQMVGYNSKKMGKAWINGNFASNKVQKVKQVGNHKERMQWERYVISSLVEICQMYSIDSNSCKDKFDYVIEQIRLKQMFTFDQLKLFIKKAIHEETSVARDQGIKEQRKPIFIESGHRPSSSNAKPSTQEFQPQRQFSNVKSSQNVKKVVMIPVAEVTRVYPVSPRERDYLNQIRNTYHHPPSSNRSMCVSPRRHDHNHVVVPRHAQSFSADLMRPQRPHQKTTNLGAQLQTISEAGESAFNASSQEASRRRQEMCRRQRQDIVLVDSMIIVESDRQEEKLLRDSRVVFDESVVLQGGGVR